MGNSMVSQLYIKQQSLSELLLWILAGIALVWYLRFLWKARKMYQTSFNVPGPFYLPLIGSVFHLGCNTPDIMEKVVHLYNHYQGIFKVWLGPMLIYCISNPKYFEILLPNSNALKKENLYRMLAPVLGTGLLTAQVPTWKKHRKIINPTFNQQILDQYVDVFVEQSEVLVQVMEKHIGKGEIDILSIISLCTLDIISESAIGVKIKAQSTKSGFPEWVDRLMEIMMTRILTLQYHVDFIFNYSSMGVEFHHLKNEIMSFTRNVVTEKRIKYENKLRNKEEEELNTTRKSFLDRLIEMNYEEEDYRFTDDELLDETITFMVAGSDTAAVTDCFVLTMLGMHQNIQEKVLAEILDVVGPKQQVDTSHLPNLKYLELVIKESLRLFPVAPFIVRDIEEDIDLGDHVVPKGTVVVFGIIIAHRNEKNWPDPYKFDPDRFLPENLSNKSPGSYIPFSFGPRNCIGLKYGMMAMKTLLVTVLRKYRVNTAYKSTEEIEIRPTILIRPKDGFKLSLELRT